MTNRPRTFASRAATIALPFFFRRSFQVLALTLFALFASACGDGDTMVPGDGDASVAGSGGAGGSGGTGGAGEGGTAGEGGSSGSGTSVTDVASFTLTPEDSTVVRGGTVALEVTLLNAEGEEIPLEDITIEDIPVVDVELTWESGNEAVATVDENGVVTAVGAGTTSVTLTITGVLNGQEFSRSATATVTVTLPALSELEISPDDETIPYEGSLQYTATAVYEDGSRDDVTELAEWSSSEDDVATIDDVGDAQAQAEGVTEITATYEGEEATTTLTVRAAALESIVVLPDEATVALGEEVRFTARGFYQDGSSASLTNSVDWSSENEDVATISGNGTAQTLSVGQTTIRAELGDAEGGEATLTVTDRELVAVTVEPEVTTVPNGLTVQYTATAHYTDGSEEDVTATATWTTGNNTIVTIDATGLARGLAEGQTTVTATYDEAVGQGTISVTDAELLSVQIDGPTLSIAAGTQTTYTLTALYSDNTARDVTSAATWSTSDSQLASVVSAGVIRGVAATPEVTITGEFETCGEPAGPCTASATLAITNAEVNAIQISGNATILIGGSHQFIATGLFTDGTTQPLTDDPNLTWSSSVGSVATISNDEGTQGLATSQVGGPAGTTQITATYDSTAAGGSFGTLVSTPSVLTVSGTSVLSLDIEPETIPGLPVGIQNNLRAFANLSDSTRVDVTSSATWSSDSGFAAVNNTTSKGQVTGIAVGSAMITASFSGQSDTASVTVSDAIVTSLLLAPVGTVSFPNGTTQTFTVTATFSNETTQDVSNNGGLTFQQTDDILDFTGPTATGTDEGTTSLRATFQGIQSNAVTVNVTDAILERIEIYEPISAPAQSFDLSVGQQRQFMATAFFTDDTSIDFTDQVTWRSSNEAKARIENVAPDQGILEALEPGTASITAQALNAQGTLITSDNTITVNVTAPALYSYIQVFEDTGEGLVGPITSWTATRFEQLDLFARGCYANGVCEPLSTGRWDVVDSTPPFDAIPHVNLSTVSGSSSTATASFPTTDLADDTALIRVRDGNSSVYTTIEVHIRDSVLEAIDVTCDLTACLPIGQEVNCTANGLFSDGTSSQLSGCSVDWSSADVEVAAHDDCGVFVTTGVGLAAITASADADGEGPLSTIISSADTGAADPVLDVQEMVANQVTVAPASSTVNGGQSQTYTATGRFTARSGTGNCTGEYFYDITNRALWGTTDEDAADVLSVDDVAFVQTYSEEVDLPTVVNVTARFDNSVNGQQNTVIGVSTLTINEACFDDIRISIHDLVDDDDYFGIPANLTANTFVELRAWGVDQDTETDDVAFDPASFGTIPFSGDVSLIDGRWILNVGNSSPGTISFTTSQGVCGGASITASVTPAFGNGLPENVYIRSLANQSGSSTTQAAVTIRQATSTDFIAVAVYSLPGYGLVEFNVSADSKSTWSNNPAVAGLTGAETPGSGGTSRTYTHVGETDGTTLITATHKNEAAPQATLTIEGKEIDRVEIDSVVVSGATTTLVAEGGVGIPAFLPITVSSTLYYVDGSSSPNHGCITYTSSDTDRLTAFGDGNRYSLASNQAETLDDEDSNSDTVTITAACEGFEDTFDLVVNDATIASITFGQGGPFKTIQRGTTSSISGILGTFSNTQSFDITNWVDREAGCVDEDCNIADLALSSSNIAAGVTVTSPSDGAAGTEQFNFSFPTTDASQFGGEAFLALYEVTVAGECFVSADIQRRIDLGSETVTDISGDLVRGFNFDVRVFGTNAEATTDITQSGTFSAPGFTNVGLVNVGGQMFRRFRSTQSTETGLQPVSFSISGDNVCAEGQLGATELSVTEYVNVTAPVPVDIELYVEPVPGEQYLVDTWHLPLGQLVQLRSYALFSDGTTAEVTVDTVLNQVASSIPGEDADLAFPCGGVLDEDDCDGGYGVVSSDGVPAGESGSVGVQGSWTWGTSTFTDTIDFISEDCGDPTVELTGDLANLPVGNDRQFTATATYEVCPTLGQQDPTGQGEEALFYDVTRFSLFDGPSADAGSGSISFVDGEWDGSASDAGLGLGETAGLVDPTVVFSRRWNADGVGGWEDDSDVQATTSSPVEVVDLVLSSLSIEFASGDPSFAETFIGDAGTLTVLVEAVYTDIDGNDYFDLAPPDLSTMVVPSTALVITRDDPRTGTVEDDPFTYYAEAQPPPSGPAERTATFDFRVLNLDSELIVSNVLTVDIYDNCVNSIRVDFYDLDGDLRVSGDHSAFGPGVPFQVSATCFDANGVQLPDVGCVPALDFSVTGDGFDDVFGNFATRLDGRVAFDASSSDVFTIHATLDESEGACLGGREGTADVDVNTTTLDEVRLRPTGVAFPNNLRLPMALGSTRTMAAAGVWEGVEYPLTLVPDLALESTNEDTVTVSDDGTGEIYADATQDGTAIVRATYGGVVSNDAYIQVESAEPVAIQIYAAPNLVNGDEDNATMPANNFRLQLFANVLFSNGAVLTGLTNAEGLAWSLEAPIVNGFEIDGDDGDIRTGIGSGAQVVVATYTGLNVDNNPADTEFQTVSTTFVVNVVNAPPESIRIVGPRDEFGEPDTDVALGNSALYEAIMTLDTTEDRNEDGLPDEYVVTSQLGWFSTLQAVGTISNGIAPAEFDSVAEGTTTITAIHAATQVFGELQVTVSPKEHVGYECRPDATISTIDKVQLHVFETFTDGSEDDITANPNTSLSTSNAGVAELFPDDPKGVVTGISIGEAFITPTVGQDSTGSACTINVISQGAFDN